VVVPALRAGVAGVEIVLGGVEHVGVDAAGHDVQRAERRVRELQPKALGEPGDARLGRGVGADAGNVEVRHHARVVDGLALPAREERLMRTGLISVAPCEAIGV
jgi:hypothetical protein